ncbi:hypothetical protein N7495_000018 [Penicillium taxi]|uniref:uncharacterized protein n=1 Tax=Penicillium taxi TaxID=168475 RepID=UPI002545A3D1|nr:uncharacterized protein N7495_000018 [Penicillium taxi]KAJ5907336.1 hypothetical protein N7495_000018 [Penicillium taxi]
MHSTMYQVEYATEQDATGLAEVNTLSFANRLMFGGFFPGASQPALRDYKAMYVMKHFVNPEIHVLKITDPIENEIVGYSRWHIPTTFREPHVPKLSEKAKIAAQDPLVFAPQPRNENLKTAFRVLLEGRRRRHTTNRDIGLFILRLSLFSTNPYVVLELLATMPSHQGRGVGSALLRWGTTQADALQARIYLEATPQGYPLYLKHGWKPVEKITLDYGQYGSEGQEGFILMMRDPRPISVTI